MKKAGDDKATENRKGNSLFLSCGRATPLQILKARRRRRRSKEEQMRTEECTWLAVYIIYVWVSVCTYI